MQKPVFSQNDLEDALALYDEQLISPLTAESMFLNGLYCILSVAERFDKHTRVYKEMLRNGLDTPESVIAGRERVEKVVSVSRFPNQRASRIHRYALWWSDEGMAFSSDVLDDVANGRKLEFDLRNRLAEEAPGLSYKAASLFMVKCGYEHVMPVDIWMIRALRDLGHDVVVPDYKRNSGPMKIEYLKLEKTLSQIADESGLSPAMFQFTLWAKYSNWKDSKAHRV